MKFAILVKGTKESEAGAMPTEEMLAEMGKFNEEMVNAGVMLGGEGFLPSSTGARVRYSGSERTVSDGPFSSDDLVSGFWLINVSSKDEAIEWAKRIPFRDGEVEIRKVAEAEDFGEAYTPELREQEDRLRAKVEGKS